MLETCPISYGSYNSSLRGRTLTGSFDLSRQLNGAPSDGPGDDSLIRVKGNEADRIRSTSLSLPDLVDGKPEIDAMDFNFVNAFGVLNNDSESYPGRRFDKCYTLYA